MPKRRNPDTQVLFTLHGINASDWQEDVRSVFEPFFDYRPLRYPQFQSRLGGLRLVAGAWVPVFTVVAAGVAAYFTRSYYLIALLMLVGAYCTRKEAKATRGAALSHVRDERDALGSYESSHIVAHSFGTFLTARLIERYDPCRLERVILVGSVLESAYDWKALLRRRPGVREVRNETGSEDWVVGLAGWARKLVPGMGNSGYRGFIGPADLIHHSASSTGPCGDCHGNIRSAKVHNCPVTYKHSEFLRATHARQIWLPVLWGYVPAEFNSFVSKCVEVARLDQARAFSELTALERQLSLSKWKWTHGRTLAAHVRREVAAYNALKKRPPMGTARIHALTSRVVRVTWQAIAIADAQLNIDKDDRSMRKMMYLWPKYAIGSSVAAVFATEDQLSR